MNQFEEGMVVIVATGQSGSIIQMAGEAWVLLKNTDIWIGSTRQIRTPQDQADLDSCPEEVDKFEKKVAIRAKE